MIWIILGVIVAFILGRYIRDLSKDDNDLQGRSSAEKFSFIVDVLNDFAFDGLGTVTVQNKRFFSLYESGENQIIHFTYSTGCLAIEWRYKYFQKEVVHTKSFANVRNLSVFEQQRIAEIMIGEMEIVKTKHTIDVLGRM